MNLCRFERPSRYINREVNTVYKRAEVKVALAFPDIYDVGMSHLGLKILYKIINELDLASAERVFSPWLDMEAEMKAKGVPLTSLETGRPVRDFDIVGFSLQYELSYTTVLNMLSMAGIPLRSGDRGERDPLVIAGGPITVNPLPMSAFIDAFLVGDGEDAVKDIMAVFHSWKKDGDRKRDSLLRALAQIEGVYVPSIFVKGQSSLIRRRYIESLDDAPYPVAPVVPFTSIVHDRINIEIARGCTMGCRFCQAGMTYRPLRERSPERILQIAKDSFRNTGHEEIALTALSAGDYGCLHDVVRQLNRTFADKVVALSLPSLRVATVDRDVLKDLKTVRKTGFTIAPEAATDRLRAVINKDFSDADYERALDALFAEGWENIKLYFMIGLPAESDEDVEAIPQMAQKAITTAKRYSRRHVNVNVGISPFVPKPHTPFQWSGQENIEVIRTKAAYLRQRLSRKGMNFKGHNTDMSLLEAVFSRGDASLGGLIEKAWALGARLDAWTEAFDFRKWLEAADATGTDIYAYASRRFKRDDDLPWDMIDAGVKREYLWEEHEKALSCEITTDCRKGCSGCGLGCRDSYELQVKSDKLKDESSCSILSTRKSLP
ncbi:MAG TPA: TIGR03960 family B12-binding radical SAM protein, partial [Thermodesulfovibrionales bacterium]|nr:TIGR03960 family B12-binding radical SAM protein [Thermodesulfovibrionales bacterium]